MLQEHAVARHQRWGRSADHLPEGEVPRHDRENDTERIIGDERFFAAEVDGLVQKIFLRVVGEPVAVEGAFPDLGKTVGQRLSHLFGHQSREFAFARAKDLGGLVEKGGAWRSSRGASLPFQESLVCPPGCAESLIERCFAIAAARLSGRGISTQRYRLCRFVDAWNALGSSSVMRTSKEDPA